MTALNKTDHLVANASPALWPARRSDVLTWLMTETSSDRYIDNIFVEMCARLLEAGIPVARATLNFLVQHPQWRGARILWRPEMKEAEFTTYPYGIEATSEYLNSPVFAVQQGASEVRRQIDDEAIDDREYGIVEELRAEGFTDYAAWPLEHTFGKRHVVSFSTTRPGGFSKVEIDTLRSLTPALALVSEVRLKNRMARTLLETYVGPHASQEILDGATRRGSGTTVGAAILICDLRNFTRISDLWTRDEVIELLNGYFDALSDPIEKQGGEILKFMGDGLLAIFPLHNESACRNLVASIKEAQIGLERLNQVNISKGREPLGYGIGVHVGDVMYGNIGSRSRLDFTVIGPAVNIASRLESLTKSVGVPVLLSEEFVTMEGNIEQFKTMGSAHLRGMEKEINIFSLR